LPPWFNLSDPAVEEALYDSRAMRGLVRIDLGREPVPDETTVCRFRHLRETHELGQQLFAEVRRHLAANGLSGADDRAGSLAPRPTPQLRLPASTLQLPRWVPRTPAISRVLR